MSDYRELTIGKAAALAAPAAAGTGASFTLLGLNAEQWAMTASAVTVLYGLVMIYLAMPRIIDRTKHCWRSLFGDKSDPTDEAGT